MPNTNAFVALPDGGTLPVQLVDGAPAQATSTQPAATPPQQAPENPFLVIPVLILSVVFAAHLLQSLVHVIVASTSAGAVKIAGRDALLFLVVAFGALFLFLMHLNFFWVAAACGGALLLLRLPLR